MGPYLNTEVTDRIECITNFKIPTFTTFKFLLPFIYHHVIRRVLNLVTDSVVKQHMKNAIRRIIKENNLQHLFPTMRSVDEKTRYKGTVCSRTDHEDPEME